MTAMHIELSLHRLQRGLLLTTGSVALAGLVVETCDHLLNPAWAPVLVPLLSLSYEHNLPTWYAVLLHASAALLIALHALSLRQAPAQPAASGRRPGDRPGGSPGSEEKQRNYEYCARPGDQPGGSPGSEPDGSRASWIARWIVLSGLFAYISIDELIQLHEVASAWFDTTGILYFGWVIPAAAIVLGLGLWYLPFLRALPPRTRRRFLAAGVVFVSGALVMELPLGWWTERAGADNLTYAMIDWVEETLELVGVSMFLLALLDIPGRAPGALRVSITSRDPHDMG